MTILTKVRRADFTDEAWQRMIDNGSVAKWEAAGLVDYSEGRTPNLGPTWAENAAQQA